MKVEKRALVVGDLQVRAADDGDGEDGFTVRGHALTFDDPYEVWDFEEQWDAGAVRDDIQDTDVFAFWSHDSSIPLARTTNGSLELRKDDVGLAVEFTLPATRQQEAEAIRTGLVDKMSVGFYVKRQRWEEREDLPDLRTILEAELLEVSPVALPANPNTDLSPREQKHLVEARRQCLGPDCRVPEYDAPEAELSRDQVDRLADALLRRLAGKYEEEGRRILEEAHQEEEEEVDVTDMGMRERRLRLAEAGAHLA